MATVVAVTDIQWTLKPGKIENGKKVRPVTKLIKAGTRFVIDDATTEAELREAGAVRNPDKNNRPLVVETAVMSQVADDNGDTDHEENGDGDGTGTADGEEAKAKKPAKKSAAKKAAKDASNLV